MRIISGKLGGRRLTSFKADHIRPTTDRVKESIFNRWMFAIEGSRVLDLYAGTGNLSFEALSRGALYVESIENNRKSLKIIQENRGALGIDKPVDSMGQHTVVNEEVLRYLDKYSGEPFDLILIDPPFTKSLANETMRAVDLSKTWHPETRIVIESSGTEYIADAYGSLRLEMRKTFGDKTVSFFTVESFVEENCK